MHCVKNNIKTQEVEYTMKLNVILINTKTQVINMSVENRVNLHVVHSYRFLYQIQHVLAKTKSDNPCLQTFAKSSY